MAPMSRSSRSTSLPRAASVVPPGQAGAGADGPVFPSLRPPAEPPAALLDRRHPEVVLPAGGGQRPGLGLQRLRRRPEGRLVAPLLVLGGLEPGEGGFQVPAPAGFALGLGGEGG